MYTLRKQPISFKPIARVNNTHLMLPHRYFTLQKHFIKIKGVGENFKKIENWEVNLNVLSIGNICVCTHAMLINTYNDTL